MLWCDGQTKMTQGGWHFKDKEASSQYEIERCICLMLVGWQEATNGSAWLLCEPIVRWLLFSSTAVQLGESFTVAFPPSRVGTKQLYRTHAGMQQQTRLLHVPETDQQSASSAFPPDWGEKKPTVWRKSIRASWCDSFSFDMFSQTLS